jgi:hypothetical protein
MTSDIRGARKMISADSPLSVLPRGLDPRQRVLLDAIRISAQCIDISYRRLAENLEKGRPGSESGKPAGIAAMLDAWSVIDSLHRLRQLVQRMPRWRNRSPGKQIFLRATAAAEKLRDSIQHLDTEADSLLRSGRPPFGALTWISPYEGGGLKMYVQSFIPGQFESANPGSLVEIPEHVPATIDQIELWAFDLQANITDAYRAVEKLVSGLEVSMRSQFSQLPTDPSDTHVYMLVELRPATDE